MSAVTRLIILIALSASPALAQEQAKSFANWKELQVLEAQNQLLRISGRINQIRAGKVKSETMVEPSTPLPSTRVKTAADSDPLSLAEKDLRRARESLENANNLTLSDYVAIYLPSLEGQPAVLQNLVDSMTKEELAEIVKTLVSRPSRINTARQAPVFSGLSNTGTSSN